MAQRGPSLTAFLGLLAVAGFQNRDKLSELARKVQGPGPDPRVEAGLIDQFKSLFSGSPVGGALVSAMDELIEMFNGTPQEKPAKTWVASGQNTHMAPDDLAAVIGDETLNDLEAKTGMSRVDLLTALSQELPIAVDYMTPNGRLPTVDEAGRYV